MKNGQSGHPDDASSPSSSPVSKDTGWGSTRCATQMNVTETADTVRIQTTLAGLEPESLIVTIRSPYFIVEGTIVYTGGRGRYARHVAELVNVREDFVDVRYETNGELTISLLKHVNGSADGHSDGQSE